MKSISKRSKVSDRATARGGQVRRGKRRGWVAPRCSRVDEQIMVSFCLCSSFSSLPTPSSPLLLADDFKSKSGKPWASETQQQLLKEWLVWTETNVYVRERAWGVRACFGEWCFFRCLTTALNPFPS